METSSRPRINGSQLARYIGSYVTLVGKVQSYTTTGVTSVPIETSDKQKVTLQFARPLNEPLSLYVEVIGQVQNNCSLNVVKSINYGDEFDLDGYDQLVQLMPQFPMIFPSQ